jgi:hypothetical protein
VGGLLLVSMKCDGVVSGVLMTTGFCHEHALILYVYLPNEHSEEESVLTVRLLELSSDFIFD